MNAHDDDDDNIDDNHETPIRRTAPHSAPSSPPPSFRSHDSSPSFSGRLSHDDPLHNEEDQTLADTFDDGEASDNEDDGDDRQRLMRADSDAAAREAEQEQEQEQEQKPTTTTGAQRTSIQRRVTELPVFTRSPLPRQQPQGGNDGVFANLAAKPERGDTGDEKPPVRSFSPCIR